ncbi:hypothetical protein Q8F55_006318 [Vanrija albida]|uniref:Peptidase A1 domain-containing protein n=1 Tax=Vanrija albida TaxID=181172 RepID=A0ABR3PX56_9TREE
MLTAVLALALASTTTTASPTAHALLPRSDGPVDIVLVAPNRTAQDGQPWIEGAASRLLAKYADLLPSDAPAKRQQQPALDTTLSDWYDWMYSAKVAIGTPPQDFYLRLDTATPYLWVYGDECTTSNCTAAKATQSLFKHGQSSTYHDLQQTATVTYVSSSCTGPWGTDVVGVTNGLEGPARSTQSSTGYQFGE